MKVYEIKVKIYMLKNVELKESREIICNLIDKSFIKDEKMINRHNKSGFKNYCFNNLYPLELDKVYKEGKIYSLIIRTLDEDLVNHFRRILVNEHNDYLKVLTLDVSIIKNRPIEKIYTISPAIAKFENGYWKTNFGLDVFEKRITENLIKKYNSIFDIKIDEDFELFTMIKLDNKKPIPCKYKNITLLGDKVTLTISSDESAQKLAYIAIATGVLEMGGRGFGFCNYKWL